MSERSKMTTPEYLPRLRIPAWVVRRDPHAVRQSRSAVRCLARKDAGRRTRIPISFVQIVSPQAVRRMEAEFVRQGVVLMERAARYSCRRRRRRPVKG